MNTASSRKSQLLHRITKRAGRELGFIRRQFVVPEQRMGADGKLRLHIGCGEVNSHHFTNVDALPYPHVHIVSDNIVNLPMFQDRAADMIYMCHVLEHVPRRQLDDVIREFGRVLKSGGILRLSVPDFDLLVAIYSAVGNDITAIADPLLGSHANKYDVHYALFNRAHLTNLLRRNGFREVRSWDPANCEYHDFEDWASKTIHLGGRDYPVSLNLEGVK